MQISEELRRRFADAERVLVLTGAGVSAESGVPTFRGGGNTAVWKGMRFDVISSAEMVARDLPAVWEWFDHRRNFMDSILPNPAHYEIARWQERFPQLTLATQNIDGLHQKAGSREVIELHGNATYAACLDCRRRYELEWVREIFAVDERLALCTGCGGMIKTATISFGQSMPEAEMQRAQEVTLAADLFIVLGSSLVVYPAAGFPIMAKRNGSRLAIVNREPTEQDELADIVINAEIGATMSRAVGVN